MTGPLFMTDDCLDVEEIDFYDDFLNENNQDLPLGVL